MTALTHFLIENSDILGENIPNLLDTDEGTAMTQLNIEILDTFGSMYPIIILEGSVKASKHTNVLRGNVAQMKEAYKML